MSLLSLPNELLLSIASHVDPHNAASRPSRSREARNAPWRTRIERRAARQTLSALCSTCARCHALFAPLLWRSLSITSSTFSPLSGRSAFSSGPSAVCPSSAAEAQDAADRLARLDPRTRALVVDLEIDTGKRVIVDLPALLAGFERLEHLSLVNVLVVPASPSTSSTAARAASPSARSSSSPGSPCAALATDEATRALKTINLKAVGGVSLADIQALVRDNSDSLEKLTLSLDICTTKEETLEPVHLPRLRGVDLSLAAGTPGSALFRLLARCDALERVCVRYAWCEAQDILAFVNGIVPTSYCPSSHSWTSEHERGESGKATGNGEESQMKTTRLVAIHDYRGDAYARVLTPEVVKAVTQSNVKLVFTNDMACCCSARGW